MILLEIVEIQNLLYKARDDLRKQEATKAEEIVITAKEKLIEAKQSSFPENLQVVDPSDERDLGTRSSNKAVDYVVSNNFERTSRSNIPNYVQCNKQKQGGSLEAPLQVIIVADFFDGKSELGIFLRLMLCESRSRQQNIMSVNPLTINGSNTMIEIVKKSKKQLRNY